MILHCKCISLGGEWGGLNRILNTPVLHYPPKLSKCASVLSNWYCPQSYHMVVQCCVAGVLEFPQAFWQVAAWARLTSCITYYKFKYRLS
ncbi:hypothetical protein NC651_019827 [Populus alba x Populus x berolinensis]|nr:hypothetical protein NC651_019827 [Populus alba x Populus x berolinensis]